MIRLLGQFTNSCPTVNFQKVSLGCSYRLHVADIGDVCLVIPNLSSSFKHGAHDILSLNISSRFCSFLALAKREIRWGGRPTSDELSIIIGYVEGHPDTNIVNIENSIAELEKLAYHNDFE